MKVGSKVLFFDSYQSEMIGVFLRKRGEFCYINSLGKLYRRKKERIVEIKGGNVDNARKRLSICCPSSGNSGCYRKKNRGIQSIKRGENKGNAVLKGAWGVRRMA